MNIGGLLIVLAAIGVAIPVSAQLPSKQTQSHIPPAVAPAFDRTRLDTTVSPCQDFYAYAIGGWAKRDTPLPESPLDVWPGTLAEVADHAQKILIQLLEHAREVAATTSDSTTHLLGVFYNSCMVAAERDSAGLIVVAPRPQGPEMRPTRAVPSPQVRCVAITKSLLGDALQRAYVQETLPLTLLAKAVSLAESVRNALVARVQTLEWLSDSAKQEARAKLTAMTLRLGIPAQWVDYSSLTLSPIDYVTNLSAIKDFVWRRKLNAIGKTEESGWELLAYTLNAVHRRYDNITEIPPIMMQPPLFSLAADPAFNYAGLGLVIGHELAHAIDNLGRLVDANGRRGRSWWTSKDTQAFSARAQWLSLVYRALAVGDTFPKVRPAFTSIESASVATAESLDPSVISEAMADLGGVQAAYDAFVKTFRTPSRIMTSPQRDAFTPAQRFFLAYANVFRRKRPHRPGDPHPPDRVRVNAAVANMPAFAAAFGCKVGDPMAWPAERRINVW